MKFIIIFLVLFTFVFANSFPSVLGEPKLFDDNLTLEEFYRETGWEYTTMTFVEDDILVLEKDGFVTLIHNKIVQEEPVLKVAVNSIVESGLLGMTSVGSTIYLYFTEVDQNGEILGNRIYRYYWN